jgi:hypothetical protein
LELICGNVHVLAGAHPGVRLLREATLTKLAKDSLQPAILLEHRQRELKEQITALWLVTAAKTTQDRTEWILPLPLVAAQHRTEHISD